MDNHNDTLRFDTTDFERSLIAYKARLQIREYTDARKYIPRIQRRRIDTHSENGKTSLPRRHRPSITREDLICILIVGQMGEEGFQKLPSFVQRRLRDGLIRFPSRQATELEMWEANADAREHRHLNNEMTINDYMDHYSTKRYLHV